MSTTDMTPRQGLVARDSNPASVLFMALCGGTFFIGVYWIVHVRFPHDGEPRLFPDSFQVPLVLAPIITAFVANWALWRVILLQRDLRARLASGVTLFWTLFLCLGLTYVTEWEWHLLLLLGLFVGFAVWDCFVYHSCTGVDKAVRREIWHGHKLINVPTIISVLTIIAVLHAVDGSGAWDVFEHKKYHGHALVGFRGAIEAFTTGVVAFHLGVSATSYVLATTRLYDATMRGILSVLKWLLAFVAGICTAVISCVAPNSK